MDLVAVEELFQHLVELGDECVVIERGEVRVASSLDAGHDPRQPLVLPDVPHARQNVLQLCLIRLDALLEGGRSGFFKHSDLAEAVAVDDLIAHADRARVLVHAGRKALAQARDEDVLCELSLWSRGVHLVPLKEVTGSFWSVPHCVGLLSH